MSDYNPMRDFETMMLKALTIWFIVMFFIMVTPWDGIIIQKQGIVVSIEESNWPYPHTSLELTQFSDRTMYATFEGRHLNITIGNTIKITLQHKAWHFYNAVLDYEDLGPSIIYTEKR